MMNAILGIIAFFVAPFIFLVFCLLQGLDWISDHTAHIGKVIAGWSFLLALLVLLYRATSNFLFMWLLIAALCLLLWTLVKRYCAKKWKRPSTPDAWICRKCGNENSDIIIECNKCGATRDDNTDRLSVKPMWVCGNCGTKNPASDDSCKHCGYRRM